MCGIAGIIQIHDPKDGTPPPPLEAIPEAWLDILDESIKHRGPDGQGRFRDRATREDGTIVDVALVHRRLSILDHQGGHQPMVHDGEHLRPDLTYQPGDPPVEHSLREGIAVFLHVSLLAGSGCRCQRGAALFFLTVFTDLDHIDHAFENQGNSERNGIQYCFILRSRPPLRL